MRDEAPRLIDTPRGHEWKAGHLARRDAGSRPIEVADRIEQQSSPTRSHTPVVLYCAAGVRSLLAGPDLAQMGYTNVDERRHRALEGRGPAGRAPGHALPSPQKPRYSRHLLIPEVGPRARRKLLESKVLFIGAGGLGSPALLYLAAAGVGTIGIVDFDVVDLSNLQRQVIHTDDRIGMKKTESARRRSRRSTRTSRSSPTTRCSPTTTSSGSSPATT